MSVAITGTLDIECANWTNFVVAGTYTPTGGGKVHRSIPDLLDYVLSVGGTWWAHCGGQYDFLALAEEIRRRGKKATPSYARSSMTRIVMKGLELRDSYALIPLSLDAAAPLAGIAAPKLPWSCRCRERERSPGGCGGYCRITTAMRAGDPDLEDYCLADCYTLYRVLDRLRELCEEHDITLKGTIGGSAWETAKTRLDLPAAPWTCGAAWQTWERIQAANYGGRDVVGASECRGPGVHWDVSSAYAAALARAPLPTGDPAELGSREAMLALNAETPGVYECTVTVPEIFVPPLPTRVNGRIVYPTGTFTGSWVLPELHAAIERGATVDAVHGAVAWTDEEVIFDDLMREWYAIRRKAGKSSAFGEWLRVLPSSLTGKFAESPLRHTLRLHPDEIKACLRQKRCRDGCTGYCGAHTQVDAWGHLWVQGYYRLGEASHLHWAAYLRAYARIHLLEGIERSGPESLVASRTDSIWTTSREAPGRTGRDLGAWEVKHEWSHWACRSPGIYRFRSGEDGHVTIRAVGAPRMTEHDWRAGHVRRKDGVLPLLSAAQEGRSLFRRRDDQWTLPDKERQWYGDRIANGKRTRPCTIDEARARPL